MPAYQLSQGIRMDANIVTALIGLAGVIAGSGITLFFSRNLRKAQVTDLVTEAFDRLAARMETQIENLQEENESLKADNATLAEKVKCLQDEIDRLNKEGDALRLDNRFLKAQNEKFAKQIAALQQENEKLRG
jgi:peptidoglycan hydrolase CwlO-like protein